MFFPEKIREVTSRGWAVSGPLANSELRHLPQDAPLRLVFGLQQGFKDALETEGVRRLANILHVAQLAVREARRAHRALEIERLA